MIEPAKSELQKIRDDIMIEFNKQQSAGNSKWSKERIKQGWETVKKYKEDLKMRGQRFDRAGIIRPSDPEPYYGPETDPKNFPYANIAGHSVLFNESRDPLLWVPPNEKIDYSKNP